ncbi:MAG: hypothetical protein LBV06_00410 [Propionibacteriaceae bacterium]|nr:hypothetical protein [Propionibacteriaceae bacterium]
MNWNTATIELPLDRFWMSPDENQVVEAAVSIEIARCLTQATSVSEAVIADARRSLEIPPVVAHWLFGRWDVAYIARHGPWGAEASSPPLQWMDGDSTELLGCRDQVAVATGLVAPTNNSDTAQGAVGVPWMESVDSARLDYRFMDLAAQLKQCINSAGYSVNASADGGGVVIESGWTDEQQQRAFLAEAQCSDDMAYVQQVGDIAAEYRLRYIGQHQAELIEAKRVADARVAKATEVLRGAGVL